MGDIFTAVVLVAVIGLVVYLVRRVKNKDDDDNNNGSSGGSSPGTQPDRDTQIP